MTVLIILIGIAAVLAVIILLSWLSSANDPSRYCDGCLKTFAADQVNPCSGDWWLCHKCLETYMKHGMCDECGKYPAPTTSGGLCEGCAAYQEHTRIN